ncbi:hypothetical protein M885DRAFT_524820 [Pelagophyceae sp. CCMP2097]|nr:hypothetical protein M885DRAFT_524820 [Pelagophyceae sp. CCMP2097]
MADLADAVDVSAEAGREVRPWDMLQRRIGSLKNAAVAALDMVDEACDTFLEAHDLTAEDESRALAPVLKMLAGDVDVLDSAELDHLRQKLERYREVSESENARLLDLHERTRLEFAQKMADYDELRLRLAKVEEQTAEGWVVLNDQAPMPRADWSLVSVHCE